MLKKLAPVSLSLLFASQAFANSNVMKCSNDEKTYDLVWNNNHTYTMFVTKDEQKEEFLSGLDCIRSKNNGAPAYYICTVDRMKADGPKNVVSIFAKDDGNYSITLAKTIRSRRDAKVLTSTEILEKSIKCEF